MAKVNTYQIDNWNKMYEEAKEYYAVMHTLEIDLTLQDKFSFNLKDLKEWLNRMRTSKNHIDKLNALNFDWHPFKSKWEETFNLAQIYYSKYHNLNIPYTFITLNGYTRSAKGVKLGEWLFRQKDYYFNQKLELERIMLLESINIIWDEEENMQKIQHLCQEYQIDYKLNFNVLYKLSYRIFLAKINYLNMAGKSLVNPQGYLVSIFTMSSEELVNIYGINILELIKKTYQKGINNKGEDRPKLEWEQMYFLAVKYYNKYHNLQMGKTFKTIDGYTFSSKGVELGNWLNYQKKLYLENNIDMEKQIKLEAIGIIWDYEEDLKAKKDLCKMLEIDYQNNEATIQKMNFSEMLAKAIYFAKNGLTIKDNKGMLTSKFLLTGDYFKEIMGVSIEYLIKVSRGLVIDDKWYEMYDLATSFYNQNGHLMVSGNFKTLDGYTEDENGKNLGNWLVNLRELYQRKELELEKIVLLNKIGMVWNIRTNEQDKLDLCLKKNINGKLNKNTLEHLTLSELEAKIYFLEHNNLPLVDDKGFLSSIFRMSDLELENNYGINLETLYMDYYSKRKLRRKENYNER